MVKEPSYFIVSSMFLWPLDARRGLNWFDVNVIIHIINIIPGNMDSISTQNALSKYFLFVHLKFEPIQLDIWTAKYIITLDFIKNT